MARITKNELVALNSGLATRIVELRALYEQVLADNARLRAAHVAQCTRIEELELTIRPSMVVENSVAAARGVASPIPAADECDERLAAQYEQSNPVEHFEDGVEFRRDTMKRIAIKFRALTRYNRKLRQYEIYDKSTHEWTVAPRT